MNDLLFEKEKNDSRLPRERMISLRQEVRAWVMSAQELRFLGAAARVYFI